VLVVAIAIVIVVVVQVLQGIHKEVFHIPTLAHRFAL
jgi:hypothetical protein